jgi:hypothetical protein
MAPLPLPVSLDHERLEVYQLALQFFDVADQVIERLTNRDRERGAEPFPRLSNLACVLGEGRVLQTEYTRPAS